MKNKFILSSLLVSVAALSISLTVLAFHSNGINKVFGDGDNHDHEVHFFSGDLTGHNSIAAYYGYGCNLLFHKDDAIVVSSSEKYDMNSLTYDEDNLAGSWYNGDESLLSFNTANGLVEVSQSQGNEEFYITFVVPSRANVNLYESLVVVHNISDSNYALNTEFEDFGEDGDGNNYYIALFDLKSNYGDRIAIEEIRLFFSC